MHKINELGCSVYSSPNLLLKIHRETFLLLQENTKTCFYLVTLHQEMGNFAILAVENFLLLEKNSACHCADQAFNILINYVYTTNVNDGSMEQSSEPPHIHNHKLSLYYLYWLCNTWLYKMTLALLAWS